MNAMTKFEKEYQQHVLQWAHDRNIIKGSDAMRQLLKTCTEAGEMVDATRAIDLDEYVDSIGDQWVTIVIGMEMACVSYQDALVSSREISSPTTTDDIVSSISLISDGILKGDKQILLKGYGEYLSILRDLPDFIDGVMKAWNTIKYRKGKMVNGVFVKEEDLVMKHTDDKVVVILNAPPGAGKDSLAFDDEWCFEVGNTLLCDYYADKGIPYIDSHTSISFKYGMFEVLRPILTVGIGEDGADEFFDRYQDRDLKEQPWDKLSGMSPRQFMIFLSENFMKVAFGKEVFGKYTAQKVKDSPSSFIILSDCGFAEEVDEVVKAVGAENVHIFQWSADGCSFNGDSRRYLTRGDVADGVRFVMLPHNTKKDNKEGWRAACLQRVQEYVESELKIA